MNCLLIGHRYLPYRHESDKNFWVELIEELKAEVGEIHILYVHRNIVSTQHHEPNVWLHSVAPVPFPMPQRRFSAAELSATSNYLSRSLSFVRIIKEAKRILSENEIDVIHFMDNYGPIMPPLLLPGIKRPLSISMMSYHPRYPAHDMLLKLTLRPFDKIVVPTNAFGKKLTELGIAKQHLRKVRWGIRTEIQPGAQRGKGLRGQLNIAPNSRIVLWSGFLQQTSFEDFACSIRVANRVLELNKNCSFVFCFKHVHFRQEYLRYAREGIEIISTKENREFLDLLDVSHVFLCPVLAKGSIVAPPLTWLEVMQRGIPIVTTRVEGVDEVITDGHSGCIAHTEQEVAAKVCQLLESEDMRATMGKNARASIMQGFDIRHIADEYLDLWSQMAAEHEQAI